ncbi:MAG: hypothetical protein M0R30_08705 [Methanoregula sp.]|jgi:beta propeller repeat protein|uniref:hypothetical protein n=1 Tax=Methanoregula sp. TaxID=2052170 RepID=UPI0025EE7E3D|nr:hypothetical protein [Methanoregula sp.]MCK9631711.1 hypothetical protein [Methanoregula sp.]
MTLLRVTFALVLVMVAMLLATGCVDENSKLLLEIPGSTTVVVPDATSGSDLEMRGVDDPALLNLFPEISRYDVVKFDSRAILRKIQSSRTLGIRISGKEYLAELTQLTSVNTDSGFKSYSGVLQNETNSSVLITISPTSFIVGSVTLDDDTYWIMPVDKEAFREDTSSVLHVIYNAKDAIDFQHPDITDIYPSEKYLHSYYRDEKTGIIRLTGPSLIGMESPMIDGDHVVWSWVYNGKRGLTLYTISTGNFTEINAEPFGLSPPKISGDYIVWADTGECVSGDQTNGLVLYEISSGNRTCICTNPKSPRFADIHGNYVVWQDSTKPDNYNVTIADSFYHYDIFLYDIRNGTESRILPDPSPQNYPSIYDDLIVWEDGRNDNGPYHKDYFLYNITDRSVRKINAVPVNNSASPPYIHDNRVLWGDAGVAVPSTVHLYNITTGQEQVLNYSSPGNVGRFSLSGNLAIWTSWEFRGSDVPEQDSHLYDLTTGTESPVCPSGTFPQLSPSVSGNNIIFQNAGGIWLCPISRDHT